jgi:hypothetical protein
MIWVAEGTMVPLAEALAELAAPPELLELELELEGVLLVGVTWMEKAGSALVATPSVAAMTMLSYLPASGADGVPDSSPVVRPKLAQTGLFWMLKLRALPLGLATVGWKL